MIPVVANQTQDSTGATGCLPQNEYDIHCHAIPGPEYKLNYLASSCNIRIEDKTCTEYECKRYAGERKVSKSKITPRKRPKGKVKRTCVGCGELSFIKGRGLCGKCYKRNEYRGTLDNYKTAQEIHELRYQEDSHDHRRERPYR